MIALVLAMLAQPSAPTVSRAADCLGVLVPNADGSSVAFISFRVAGTADQLARIRAEALRIGALAAPPKKVEGRQMLLVFFENTVDPITAVRFYNRVDNGEFHPGVPKRSIEIERMTLPASTLKNCKK